MTANRPRRTVWIASAAVLLVAVVAVVLVVVLRAPGGHDDGTDRPPPLSSHAAGVQRLTVIRIGNPSDPTGGATLADGTKVGLGLLKRYDGTAPHTARIDVLPDGDTAKAHFHTVKQGDTVTDYGVRIKVLKIWRVKNPADDAVDVQVEPAGS
ncbi:hypothetical protein [Streptomyces sp. NBC_00859]|uniref:hypothetical protein n=1 Tax=Streptomyces sp. NBC_00859 TaxID=2903682 RepID=UPI00386A2115|nr:hypothetical protein OG584_10445 [Streptomyces sp. NBC_00859]